MPRAPRNFVPGQALHVVRRGHNRSACFTAPGHATLFLALLEEHAERRGCVIHAYVLMPNHAHVLLTPSDPIGPSRLMQVVGQRYAQFVHRHSGRTGALWDGRMYASPVTTDAHALACYRYIEQNPVRASLVPEPGAYTWSSHRANAGLESSRFLVRHAAYEALGATRESTIRAYRQLFAEPLDSGWIAMIREATYGNRPLQDPPVPEQCQSGVTPGSGPVLTPV